MLENTIRFAEAVQRFKLHVGACACTHALTLAQRSIGTSTYVFRVDLVSHNPISHGNMSGMYLWQFQSHIPAQLDHKVGHVLWPTVYGNPYRFPVRIIWALAIMPRKRRGKQDKAGLCANAIELHLAVDSGQI